MIVESDEKLGRKWIWEGADQHMYAPGIGRSICFEFWKRKSSFHADDV